MLFRFIQLFTSQFLQSDCDAMPSLFDNLPMEIVVHILFQIDQLADLKSAKLVCKLWHSIIIDPHYAMCHIDRSISSTINCKVNVLNFYIKKFSSVQKIDILDLDYDSLLYSRLNKRLFVQMHTTCTEKVEHMFEICYVEDNTDYMRYEHVITDDKLASILTGCENFGWSIESGHIHEHIIHHDLYPENTHLENIRALIECRCQITPIDWCIDTKTNTTKYEYQPDKVTLQKRKATLHC